MRPFHFWLAHPIMGLLVGQLRMTDIYSNLRPYCTALAEVIKIQVYAGVKSECFHGFLRHVLHQGSFFLCASLILFLFFYCLLTSAWVFQGAQGKWGPSSY